MSRDLTPTTVTEIEQPEVFPFFAVELRLDNNIIRMWTGQGTLTLADSTEWVGLGQLLDISSIEETSEMAVKGASITLSGIPSDLLSLALSEPYQGRVAKIYFGIRASSLSLEPSLSLTFDGSQYSSFASPDWYGEDIFNELFSGYMDQMNIEEGGDTSTIQLAVENKLIDLERARVARYTSGYQKSVYPNDLGMDFIEDLQDKQIPWGRKAD
jgi:hypothetical protein